MNKLRTIAADLNKISYVINSDVVKKLWLTVKVNAIDTSGFVLKTQYNTDKSNLEKKIDDADGMWKEFYVINWYEISI